MLWNESGITSYSTPLNAIAQFGYEACAFGHWFLLGAVVLMIVIEKATQVSSKVRQWMVGSIVVSLNALVFAALISLVITHTVSAPVFLRKAEFLARYSNAAGVFAVAEQRWNAKYERRIKFGLNPNGELQYFEHDHIGALLDILDGGATVGVRRSTVGSLLHFEDRLRQRKEWGDRFLESLNKLADQRLDNMDDVVAWYQTMAETPEWKAAL